MVGVVDVITFKDIPGRRSVSFSGMNEDLLAENEVLKINPMSFTCSYKRLITYQCGNTFKIKSNNLNMTV